MGGSVPPWVVVPSSLQPPCHALSRRFRRGPPQALTPDIIGDIFKNTGARMPKDPRAPRAVPRLPGKFFLPRSGNLFRAPGGWRTCLPPAGVAADCFI
jgi:hypothetical protein